MATLAGDEVQRDLAIHGNKAQRWFIPKWPFPLMFSQKWGDTVLLVDLQMKYFGD